MSKAIPKRISIYLSVDRGTINDYFNPHDPSPIYKRQLRQDFITYIMGSVTGYRRNSVLQYKVTTNERDKDLVEPLIHSIRHHFQQKEQLKQQEFERFRKRSYKLLAMSLCVVMACQILLAVIDEHSVLSTLGHGLDIFGWVVMWNPIDRLVFNWNPFLKELSLLKKLSGSDVSVIENTAVEVSPKLKISA